jgi:hypothetical protein
MRGPPPSFHWRCRGAAPRTGNHPSFTTAEARELFEQARDAAGSSRSMGASRARARFCQCYLMRVLPQRARRGVSKETHTAGIGNGQRAAIAVNEPRGSVHDACAKIWQGDKTKPDYLKINPTARIPILIEPDSPGGKPLTLSQSWRILYLAQKGGKTDPERSQGRRPDLSIARGDGP